VATTQLRETMHQNGFWESQTGQKADLFPSLIPGYVPPVKEQNKANSTPQVWGNVQNLKEIKSATGKNVPKRNNIVLNDHKL